MLAIVRVIICVMLLILLKYTMSLAIKFEDGIKDDIWKTASGGRLLSLASIRTTMSRCTEINK